MDRNVGAASENMTSAYLASLVPSSTITTFMMRVFRGKKEMTALILPFLFSAS